MTLPYDLNVRFDEVSEAGSLSGSVLVIVRNSCTCRKLLLHPGSKQRDNEVFCRHGHTQTLADWDEWRPGETYSYPFTFKVDGTSANPGVETEVHRIGEWDADPVQLWMAESAQRTPEESHLTNEDSPSGPAAVPQRSTTSTTEASSLVENVSLEFDRNNMEFAFGEEITGSVTFVPAQALADCRVGLDYQWRTHGKTPRRSGEHHPVSISMQSSWKARKRYRLPFCFSIPSGPRTSHGHSEKLDWYVWPVLIPLDGTTPRPLVQAETEIELYPAQQEGKGLVVKKQSVRHSHLFSSIFLILVSMFLGGVFLITIPLAFSALDAKGFLVYFFFMLAFCLFPFYLSIQNLLERGIAELRLGKVRADFDGVGEVKVVVLLRPRHNVYLKRMSLRIEVQEKTTVREGTGSTTTTRQIFSSGKTKNVIKRVSAGKEWTEEITVSIPPSLPPSQVRRQGRSVKVAIVWQAYLTIKQMEGRRSWHKEYTLKVKSGGSQV